MSLCHPSNACLDIRAVSILRGDDIDVMSIAQDMLFTFCKTYIPYRHFPVNNKSENRKKKNLQLLLSKEAA